MTTIWVVTVPTTEDGSRELIRAEVLTSFTGSAQNVLAVRPGAQLRVALAAGAADRPLPRGFHVSFVQILDLITRTHSDRDKVVSAAFDDAEQGWQWTVGDAFVLTAGQGAYGPKSSSC
ncbi:hypothetical protein AB0M29_43730 [Streptomyces sp. NPDC051976]|uniref:hypothetical protein n=1 Tax=Streptomyces sp. NPDC051976 TaxID=3154947 RepID=UPI0034143E1F